MQDTVFRSLENPRVLNTPIFPEAVQHKEGCPHKQNEETQGTQLVPHIVVKRNALGHIENNAEKRRELFEAFEKELGLEDTIYPLTEPKEDGIRVLKNRGIIVRELDV